MHLNDPLFFEEIAKQAYLSIPHLYKIFPVMTGCTLGQYIRKRRLTSSVCELLNTNKRVIDIACDFQFESQESYIRAFKSMFGITPGEYRKSKGIIALYNPLHLNKVQKKGELTMQPNIIAKKFLLVGVVAEIDLRSDFSEILENLRHKLKRNLEIISNKIVPIRMVGIWLPYDDNSGEENGAKRLYFTGFEVSSIDNILSNLIAKDLPESIFAIFREKTRGTISRYAYTEWLPTSGYILNENLMGDFEIFDNIERYGAEDECDILLPIRAHYEA
jgi:AraC family transcriptional regulator